MKRYYARELSAEHFDYSKYYDEECAKNDHFFAKGDDFCINEGFISDIVYNLDKAVYDIKLDLDNIEEEENEDTDLDEERDSIILTNINYYLYKEHDGIREAFSSTEAAKLFELAQQYFDDEEDETLCKILEVIFCEPYKTGVMRGNSQGDFARYICPSYLSAKALDYIEAVIFATGIEFEVSAEKIESADEFESCESSTYYVTSGTRDEIKSELLESLGCDENELCVLLIDETHYYVEYTYKEI